MVLVCKLRQLQLLVVQVPSQCCDVIAVTGHPAMVRCNDVHAPDIKRLANAELWRSIKRSKKKKKMMMM